MNKEIKLADLRREYDRGFVPSKEYLDSMPDLQNGEFVGIPIDYVGIAGMKFPLIIRQKDGGEQEVLATVIGSVDLDSQSRGINMSRILRTWAIMQEDVKVMSIDDLVQVVDNYRSKLGSLAAHISVEFEYRMWVNSLRSTDETGLPNGGWQYYPVVFDVDIDKLGNVTTIMDVNYTYSSHCPCSTELAQHAAFTRGIVGSPHAQRSRAKASVRFSEMVWIEDVIEAMRAGVESEVQVFVKREDEQAFAELCAAKGTVFVEDAIRKFSDSLDKVPGVLDYKVACCHMESLHNHDAIACRTKGVPSSPFKPTFTMAEWRELTR